MEKRNGHHDAIIRPRIDYLHTVVLHAVRVLVEGNLKKIYSFCLRQVSLCLFYPQVP